MTHNPPRVPVHVPLTDATRTLRNSGCTCLAVTDNDIPVGLITEQDMLSVLCDLLAHPDQPPRVQDIMTPPPVCLEADSSLYEALTIMDAQHLEHLPVVDELKKLVGVISQADIAQAHYVAMERRRETVEQLIRDHAHQLTQANQQLKTLAMQDGLLSIGNRRAMEVDLQLIHNNAQRYSHPYALVLLDVDYFKHFNDHYGHQAGDRVLKAVADCVKNSIRGGDRLYRYGGEEFLVVMPETHVYEAVEAARRILNNMQRRAIDHEKSPYKVVTLSAGVGDINTLNERSWQQVVADADKFLYMAKEVGRNQICWNVRDNTLSDTGQFKAIQ